MNPLRPTLIATAAIALAMTLGSAFACMHQLMPEQLSSNPGLYSSAFVLIP